MDPIESAGLLPEGLEEFACVVQLELGLPRGVESYTAVEGESGEEVVLLHFQHPHFDRGRLLTEEEQRYSTLSEAVSLPPIIRRRRVSDDVWYVLGGLRGLEPVGDAVDSAQGEALVGYLANLEVHLGEPCLKVQPEQLFFDAHRLHFKAYGLILGDHLRGDGEEPLERVADLIGYELSNITSFSEWAAAVDQPVGGIAEQRRAFLGLATGAIDAELWVSVWESLDKARLLGPATPELLRVELKAALLEPNRLRLADSVAEVDVLVRNDVAGPELRRLLAAAYDDLGRTDEALELLTELIEQKVPALTKVLFLRAAVNERVGDLEQAFHDLATAYALVPEEGALEELARMANRLQRPGLIGEAWECSPCAVSSPDLADRILRSRRRRGDSRKAAGLIPDMALTVSTITPELLKTIERVLTTAFDDRRRWLVLVEKLARLGKVPPVTLAEAYFKSAWYDKVMVLAAGHPEVVAVQDFALMARVHEGDVSAELCAALEKRWAEGGGIAPGYLAQTYRLLGRLDKLASLRSDALRRGRWRQQEEERFGNL